jgi:hypothetical protein
MGDAFGEFFLVMRYHYEGLVLTTAECVYNLFHKGTMLKVEAMQGFVQNQQFGVLYKGAGQQAQTLLSTAEFKECAVGQILDTEDIHPS